MIDWIKLNSKSPVPNQQIFVTIEDASGKPMVIPCLAIEGDRVQLEEGPNLRTLSYSAVKAWMPFPEPYKEE